LQERADVIESKLRQKIPQVRHADAAVAAHVYPAEEAYVGCQIDQRPVSDTPRT
jgi:hypothetical protein